MKRICPPLLLTLLLPALARADVVSVEASRLNVRASAAGAVLGQVQRGQRFVAGQRQGGWRAIHWGGRLAWVFERYLQLVPGAEAVEVDASALNVRRGPGLSASRLGLIFRGQRYAVLRRSGQWVQLQLDGRAGWAHGRYLKPVVSPRSPSPQTPSQPTGGGGWEAVHAGLEQGGAPIPRRGLANPTLRRALGPAVEPHGERIAHGGHAFVAGTVSWFGGPSDRVVGPNETGALTLERLRALNTPLRPTAAQVLQRPGDFFYAAMRFDYGPRGKRWWAGARLLVVNPRSGVAVVVRPVDWGPHTRVGRILDLSPHALDALGLKTDETAWIAFAAPGTPLGVVR